MERDCGYEEGLECANQINSVANGEIPLDNGSGTTKSGYLITPLKRIQEYAKKKILMLSL